MYEIQTFNTKNYNWSTKVASGDSIDSRIGHSAVLAQNGDIIIYGGNKFNDIFTPAIPYIAKLDTSSWMWSIPNLSQINAPQLSFHSAALYRNYMIIAFGLSPSVSSKSYFALSNNLYILDIKNYTWVTSFNPNKSPPNQTPSNYNLFIGIGIGAGIILLGVFSVIGFLLYKRKKQNQYPKFIPTPGTTDQINIMK
ncbi:galactose oxidase [Gigaspora margarita]|uniref:Galactose oxidase n=1 Tax=Gigaspora margarita TaxID=4874 RepID=A0A8H4AZN4_GIGMA|nr:galactose oxidase [Gigaspora margarita]